MTVLYLDVPSDPSSLRVVRTMAAAAASEVVRDVARLDDLRLAVDELAVALIGAAPPPARMHVTIHVDPAAVVVDGRATADGAVPLLSEVGEMLLHSIADHHELGRSDSELYFRVKVGTG